MSTETVKLVSAALLGRLCDDAAASPRKRTNFNLHASPADPVQRFLNVLQPGTYVRPHRHDDPAKWELTLALAGRAAILILAPDGAVLERIELDASGATRGVEIPAGTWHTCAALVPDTVLLEVKRGPYDPGSDKHFADWAPAEGSPECVAFERRFRDAQPGDRLPMAR